MRSHTLELRAHGPYAVVNAAGELDIAAVAPLREAVLRGAHRAPGVVVDLRPVTFMDTFALHALIELEYEAPLHIVAPVAAGVQLVIDRAGAREELRWISAEQID